MRITRATMGDVDRLAWLIWLDTHGQEPAADAVVGFAGELVRWWATRQDSHAAFVARLGDPAIVGMAWVALVPRVPRPGTVTRLCGDIQTVFVLPEARGQGIGSAVVDAAARFAEEQGAVRVTVQSGRRAVPVYERLGFGSSGRLLQRPANEPSRR